MPKPFVFNDETAKNSYGFSIPTSGISLKRFKKNPIMLDSHYNSTRSVLGRWDNITTDKGLLLGEPVFDSADESVTVIEGKVERGFITSCSMGITFNREDLKVVAGMLILEKCELYEVSIVAVPSNANSIRLYAEGCDVPLTDTEVQSLCLSVLPVDYEHVQPTHQNPENNDMKIKLTMLAALALGFKADELEHEDTVINERIQNLSAQKQAAELQLSTIKADQEAAKLVGIQNKVKLAIKANPALAVKEQDFVNLGIANEALLDSTLAALPAKASFAAQVTGCGASSEVKTVEDFMKLTHEAQLEFKTTSPDQYKLLFTPKQ